MPRLGGGFGVSRFCHDVSLIVEAHARASRRGGALHGWRRDRCKGDLTNGGEQGTRHQRCTRWSSASCWPPHWGPRRSQRWQTAHGGPRQSLCHLRDPREPPRWVQSLTWMPIVGFPFSRRHFSPPRREKLLTDSSSGPHGEKFPQKVAVWGKRGRLLLPDACQTLIAVDCRVLQPECCSIASLHSRYNLLVRGDFS